MNFLLRVLCLCVCFLAVYSASSATSGETRRSAGSAIRANTANKLLLSETLSAHDVPEFYVDVLHEYLSALGKLCCPLVCVLSFASMRDAAPTVY